MNPKPSKKKPSDRKQSPAAATAGPLKGWTAIAHFLGIPVATAHRWASEGMPVRREGRFTVADREAVSAWLGRESHMPKPAHVMTKDADMATALKESIEAARKLKRDKKKPKA
jgi:phage terminase Nu1 subunit (DNA packaging protein)